MFSHVPTIILALMALGIVGFAFYTDFLDRRERREFMRDQRANYYALTQIQKNCLAGKYDELPDATIDDVIDADYEFYNMAYLCQK